MYVRLKELFSSPAATVVVVAALSWVAIFNGAPLVFSDSIGYATAALRHEIPGVFSPIYSYLIAPLHLGYSLWPVVFAQSLALGGVIHLFLRCTSSASSSVVVLSVLLLCLFSSLPWVSGQILPDVFTSVMVLGLFLLAFCASCLSRGELYSLIAITTIAVGTHLSHVPIATGLVILCLLIRSRSGPHRFGLKQTVLLTAGPLVVAIATLLSVNLLASGQVGLSRNSNVFLLAKWIDEGPALAHLRNNCPEAGYALCDYLDALDGKTHDELKWAWDSPFYKVGGFDQLEPEALVIVRRTFAEHPLEILFHSAMGASDQLLRFATGDGLTPEYAKMVAPYLNGIFPSEVAESILASRQATGTLLVEQFRHLHFVVLAACLAFCTLCAAFWWRALPKPLRLFYVYLPLAILWNAAVTGGLSGPFDRYLGRIIWIIPLVALASAYSLASNYNSTRGSGRVQRGAALVSH